MSAWRFTAVSVIGTDHVRHSVPCQDASLCRLRGDALICAVADGAGTAARADAGARIAVEQYTQWACGIACAAEIDRDAVNGFIRALHDTLAEQARQDGAAVSDYAATLLGIVAATDATMCIQIGDGAIVVPASSPGAHEAVFWPQHDEYANSTNFVTQENAADVVALRILPPVTEFAMFSDGLERLILDEAVRGVHAPALRPIFDWFCTSAAEDADQRALALISYLKSEHINQRTNDDKSLLVAVRTS